MIVLEILGYILLSIVSLCFLYALSGLVCSLIPTNIKYKNHPRDVEIHLLSDGVHTDYIVPCKNDFFDWSNVLNDETYKTKFSDESYLRFGWGDRGFFLEIPSWAELTPKVAMRAMLIPSKTVMHVWSHIEIPNDKKFFSNIHLSGEQYQDLCSYIHSYFKTNNEGVMEIEGVGYTKNDNFYEGTGYYHAFITCNYWVNKGLKKVGVRVPVWCHMGNSIFYQLRKVVSINFLGSPVLN